MTEEELKVLAREYAQNKGKEMEEKESLPDCLIKEVMEMDAGELTHFLTWLSRRFYLVEKNKVEEEYHEAEVFCNKIDPCGESWDEWYAQKSVLERLFPEIGKEVEE